MPYKNKIKEREYQNNYYNKNKVKLNKQSREWKLKNKEKIKLYMREYNSKQKVKLRRKEYMREYIKTKKSRKYRGKYSQRPEAIARRKEYSQRPLVKTKMKEYNRKYKKTPQRIKYNKEYIKNRCKIDKNFAIKIRLRCLLSKALERYTKTGKIYSSRQYEINYKAIIEHLKPFPTNLKNYEIDHIIPLCRFDLNYSNQIKEAFAPENHQWLTIQENRSKGGKI